MPIELASHVRREALTNGITNCVFNGGIAWWLIQHRESIPVWGGQGLAVDFIATALVLVFIVTLIVIPLTRRKITSGKLAMVSWEPGKISRTLAFLARRHLALCALILGVVAAVLFVPPAVFILDALNISALTAAQFAVTKGIWAGILAAVMVVPMLGVVTYAGELAAEQV